MKRFYFRIYQNGDEDGNNIWIMADTKQEAEREIYREYHSIDDLIFLRME